MPFRNQRDLTELYGRQGWLRPAMPVPNGDTDHFRGRKELEVAPAGLPGVPTRGRLLMRSELPGPCLWTETTAVSM